MRMIHLSSGIGFINVGVGIASVAFFALQRQWVQAGMFLAIVVLGLLSIIFKEQGK